MDWQAQGILLALRPYGESSALVEVMTEAHGRHAGIVRGGMSRRRGPVLEPGAQLDLHWRARLEDHLGAFTVEPLRVRAAHMLGDRRALAALSSVCALLLRALPERAPHPALYRATVAFLDALTDEVAGEVAGHTGSAAAADAGWPLLYLHWEAGLLREIGFGLDLGCCAVTGATEGLAFVSPRTGRAVSHAGAGAWAARLLPLPACLVAAATRPVPTATTEIAQGLALTGHFLDRALSEGDAARRLPEARARLVALLARG